MKEMMDQREDILKKGMERMQQTMETGRHQIQLMCNQIQQQYTSHGYAPYTRKRHHSNETNSQVPNTLPIYTQLPPWQPPNPTPPPESQPSPMDQSTNPTLPPPLPTLPHTQTQTNCQASSPPHPVQTIRPLMDITFTPHTPHRPPY